MPLALGLSRPKRNCFVIHRVGTKPFKIEPHELIEILETSEEEKVSLLAFSVPLLGDFNRHVTVTSSDAVSLSRASYRSRCPSRQGCAQLMKRLRAALLRGDWLHTSTTRRLLPS